MSEFGKIALILVLAVCICVFNEIVGAHMDYDSKK